MSQSFAVLPAFLFFDGQALSAVHLPAVPYATDNHHKLVVPNRIDNAPFAHANTVKVFRPGHLDYAGVSRIVFKKTYCADHAFA